MFRIKATKNLTLLGFILVVSFVFIALFAQAIAPYDPLQIALNESLQKPSWAHLMGTDILGRDVFSRIIYGTRTSLTIGVAATGISLVIGVVVGAISGYYGGWIDSLIMRITDVFLAFPFFLLALAIMTFLGSSFMNVFLVLGTVGWTHYARLVRGQVMFVKVSLFIEAARALGAKDSRIVFKHILPSSIAPVIAYMTLNIGSVILAEAGLSFLGMGVHPPAASWGLMLAESKDYFFNASWMVIWPGTAIFLTVLGYNLLGDGLRDALDPRFKQYTKSKSKKGW
ncbi:ABC-type dipeptide/oligopeptide/nickel transport system, permease component [Desulfosporosinus orientis DSM 765]|uniref:ABC-type dipeptide/oligopeptide/nickel transport system, permease component n=1 Tax=Desulfosporosinus orientis (strain ATCC 19365 / DSM 765 / NCIMB 8382 / VKM B-1628 / Singapore I) TaxID=768706 RepID=G7WDW4_DESOD|nr:ABC transporter permease [Desulfosporosinus orientis]AET68871.1 ABC-type dipeptide/oligopeptide/nickel transport system, permease component [Desulfosporosinus orientis DSM 765]